MDTQMTVQQVASKTGLSGHTIRYYERIGLIPPVKRARNGHRRFSEDDIGWIEFLKCLRGTGMPISEMLLYVQLERKGDETLAGRLELLQTHRQRIKDRISELHGLLERIEGKIGWYTANTRS